eukprot:7426133-Pyramimonas_sp.AAC.1
MVTSNAATATILPSGQPALSSSAVQATAAIAPATDAHMPLVAEPANNAGAPAATAPAGLPDNDMWLKRIERATESSAHWLKYHMHTCPTGLTSARETSA